MERTTIWRSPLYSAALRIFSIKIAIDSATVSKVRLVLGIKKGI